MSDSERVERVARAICEAEGYTWSAALPPIYFEVAEAALAAADGPQPDLDQLTDRAVEAFDDEYRKHIGPYSDEEEHEDAIRAAIEAVVMLAREGTVPHLEAAPPSWWQAKAEQAERERVEAREELRQERERAARLRKALRLLSDPDEPPYPDWAFADRAEDREEQMHKYAETVLRKDNEQGGTA